MEKVYDIRNEMERLSKLEKELLKKHKQEERDARTKRFCTRHGMMEKHMPDLIKLTDQQFETYIIKTINTSFGREKLAQMIAQSEKSIPQTPANVAETAEDGVSANPQNKARSGA